MRLDFQAELSTKVVTIDRRLSCKDPIEYQYYRLDKEKMGEKHQRNVCAFCNMELSKHDTEILNTHLSQGSQVNPNCAEVSCLKLNPRANFKDGWGLKLSKKRKRENGAQSKSKKKKKKKRRKSVRQSQHNLKSRNRRQREASGNLACQSQSPQSPCPTPQSARFQNVNQFCWLKDVSVLKKC